MARTTFLGSARLRVLMLSVVVVLLLGDLWAIF